MFRLLFIQFILFLLFSESVGQIRIGTCRDRAMAGASIASAAPIGIPLNIAAINPAHDGSISADICNRYTLNELTQYSLSIMKIIKSNLLLQTGLGRIQNPAFTQQVIELGVAKKLGRKFSAGVKMQWMQWMLDDNYYNDSHYILPEAFLHVTPFQNVSFGAIIRNPTRVRLDAASYQSLPAEIHIGVCAHLSEKTSLNGSLKQISDSEMSYQLGVEYIFSSKLFLRTGYHTLPATESIGLGFLLKKFALEVSFETNSVLGISSASSISFSL